MKKKLLIALAVVCLLIIAGALAYQTRAIEFYTMSTASNLPTYKTDDWVVGSSLKKPDNNDFIVFSRKNNIWIFRCIGKPGDVVELKDAVVYINGKALKEPYTMKRHFITTKEALAQNDYFMNSNVAPKEIYYGLSYTTLSDNELKQLEKKMGRKLKPFFKSKGDISTPDLYAPYLEKGYNEDNIGPIKIPADSYFVLGDNRHEAFDSRYFGLVKDTAIIATIVR